MFSAITETLWTRFVQIELNSCKIFFARVVCFLQKIYKIQTYLARSCKSLSMIMHFFAKSCKSFCNNFGRVAFYLNSGSGQRYDKLEFLGLLLVLKKQNRYGSIFENPFCVYRDEFSRLLQEIWSFAVNLQNFEEIYFFFTTGIPS